MKNIDTADITCYNNTMSLINKLYEYPILKEPMLMVNAYMIRVAQRFPP